MKINFTFITKFFVLILCVIDNYSFGDYSELLTNGSPLYSGFSEIYDLLITHNDDFEIKLDQIDKFITSLIVTTIFFIITHFNQSTVFYASTLFVTGLKFRRKLMNYSEDIQIQLALELFIILSITSIFISMNLTKTTLNSVSQPQYPESPRGSKRRLGTSKY